MQLGYRTNHVQVRGCRIVSWFVCLSVCLSVNLFVSLFVQGIMTNCSRSGAVWLQNKSCSGELLQDCQSVCLSVCLSVVSFNLPH